ncbi:MAG: hypothetical protein KJZ86_03895 [Caldilineaceae bacterium]|nr:hypothetical protein [Caldilineaceae bacterium]HRJ41012.1 hypothetical protein [Caldilineaceae bacterium]
MQSQTRSAIVISALLTTLIMALIGGGLLIYSGMLPLNGVSAAGEVSRQVQEEAPIVVTVQPVLAPAMQQAETVSVETALALPAQTQPGLMGSEEVAALIDEALAAQSAADVQTIAVYQTQLEESYQALEDAYRQIETLQTAQEQVSSGRSYDDDDHDDDDDDDHDDHKSGEREHDDD